MTWSVAVYCAQNMKRIELQRSSPVQIHEPPILIQSNPADDSVAQSSPVQSEHNRVDIYQIPSKLYMWEPTVMCIAEYFRVEVTMRRNCLKSLNMEYTLHISRSNPIQNPLRWWISDPVQTKSAWTGLDYESSGLILSIPYSEFICAREHVSTYTRQKGCNMVSLIWMAYDFGPSPTTNSWRTSS